MSGVGAETGRGREVQDALSEVRGLLGAHGVDAVVLGTQGSVAWLGAGLSNRLLRGRLSGVIWIVVTADRATLLAWDTERVRLEQEEDVGSLGLETMWVPWHTPSWLDIVRRDVCAPGDVVLGDDGIGLGVDLSASIRRLRSRLSPAAQDRLAAVSAQAADVVEDVLLRTRPGQTEAHLAAQVSAGLEERLIMPLVLLVGSGERLDAFRHWVPTATAIRDAATVTVAAERSGLVTVVSRSRAWVRDPGREDRARRVQEVAAMTIAATRPGATWGEALQAGADHYAAVGFPDEWRRHVQGGAVGFDTREFSPGPAALPNEFSGLPVEPGQAAAWNPTLPGAKSEDTVQITPAGPVLLTRTDRWPMRAVPTPAGPIDLPETYPA